MPELAHQFVCCACEKEVLEKVTASSVVGLPFFGVGALLAASLGLSICEWNWEHKDEPGVCARCGRSSNALKSKHVMLPGLNDLKDQHALLHSSPRAGTAVPGRRAQSVRKQGTRRPLYSAKGSR